MQEGQDIIAGAIDVWFDYSCKLIGCQSEKPWAFAYRMSPWAIAIRGDWRGSFDPDQIYQLRSNQDVLIVEGQGDWYVEGDLICLQWHSEAAEQIHQWIDQNIIPSLIQHCQQGHCSLNKLFALWRWYALTENQEALLSSFALHIQEIHPRLSVVAMAAGLCRWLSEQAEDGAMKSFWRDQAGHWLSQIDASHDESFPLCQWVRPWLEQPHGSLPTSATSSTNPSDEQADRASSPAQWLTQPTTFPGEQDGLDPLPSLSLPLVEQQALQALVIAQKGVDAQWQEVEARQLQLERLMQSGFQESQQAQRRWQQATAQMADLAHWHQTLSQQTLCLQEELAQLTLERRQIHQQSQHLRQLEQTYQHQWGMLEQLQRDWHASQSSKLHEQLHKEQQQQNQQVEQLQVQLVQQLQQLQRHQDQQTTLQQQILTLQHELEHQRKLERLHQTENIELARQLQHIQALQLAEKSQWQVTNDTIRQQNHQSKQQYLQLEQQHHQSMLDYQQLQGKYQEVQQQLQQQQLGVQQTPSSQTFVELQQQYEQVQTLQKAQLAQLEQDRVAHQSLQQAYDKLHQQWIAQQQSVQQMEQQQQVQQTQWNAEKQQLAQQVQRLELQSQQLLAEGQQLESRYQGKIQQLEQQWEQQGLHHQQETQRWQDERKHWQMEQQKHQEAWAAQAVAQDHATQDAALTAAVAQHVQKIASLEQANQNLQQQWFATQAALEQETLRRQASDEQLASLRSVMQRSSSASGPKATQPVRSESAGQPAGSHPPSSVQISGKISVGPPPLPPQANAQPVKSNPQPSALFDEHELTTISNTSIVLNKKSF